MADRTTNKIFTTGSIKRPVSDLDFVNDDPWAKWRNLPEEMDIILDKGRYTNDLPKLQEHTHQYVFVYGTLKRSFRNAHYLSKSELCGTGYTKDDRFVMANNFQFGFPIAFFDNRVETRAKIYGELYKTDANTIKMLDYLESNGIMYKRFPLSVEVFNRDGGMTSVRAWVYLGIKDYWVPKAEQLDIAKRVKPNNKDFPSYYIFTVPDEL